nr:ATP-dependent DNA helicase PIF1-like [Tanacetum cinerariifolium]
PLQLWEENWVALSDDILHKKQKLYRYPELQLTKEQLRNYCLLEIQELLNRHGKSLREFQDLPQLNPRLRSARMIVLAVASSGIASLLLPGGRTAHTRFVIPLELMENNKCGIKQNTHLAELMQEVQLVIWDEAPMTQRYAFEALDKTLRDILGYKSPGKRNRLFGGMPPHALSLKKKLPIMLIQNVDPSKGLCSGTRLIITELAQFLYVALSRVTSPDGLKILMIEDEDKELKYCTQNIVFKKAFNNM